MIIEIKPFDTLFFRDGKPFSMGSETWADSIFPPSPSVFYGAIRTAYFSLNPNELDLANTENDPTKDFKIKSICFYKDNNPCFTTPEDLGEIKKEKSKLLDLKEINNINSSIHENITHILYSNEELKKIEGGLISSNNFRNYLIHSKNDFDIDYLSKYIISEPKTGIKRKDETLNSDDGNLYRVGMQRLKDISFLVDVDTGDKNINPKGFMKLGAENKIINYESKRDDELKAISPNSLFNNILNKTDTKRFKIYFMTPCIFNNGFIPSWIDPETLEGEFNGIKVKLLTYSIQNPIYIGGFDVKERKSKSSNKAIPAGSVYYFETLENYKFQDILDVFHYKSLSEIKANEGFGISLVGVIK